MVNKEAEADPSPDPRPALFDLLEDCRKRGIHLVLAPVPDKGMLEPHELTERVPAQAPVPNNPSFAELVAELKSRGADVFEDFPQQVQSNEVRYLKQDTHWNPQFMEEYAAGLANHIRGLGLLPAPAAAPRFGIVASAQSNFGDLVNMLKLPPSQTQFPKETVELHRVIDTATGRATTADPHAPVLMLGDSFANIFSLATLGWGEGAGLPQHLAYRLNQAIDAITLNGGGATGIRIELARAAAQGRLEGKKVLVYEFAMRNLAVENWRRIRLPEKPRITRVIAAEARSLNESMQVSDMRTHPQDRVSSRASGASAPALAASDDPRDGVVRLVGKVRKLSTMPVPGVSPYRDCLNMTLIEVERVIAGQYEDSVALVAFEVMRDNQLTDHARLQPGDRLEMELRLLRKAGDRFQTMQRSDDLDDFEHRAYFVLSSRPL